MAKNRYINTKFWSDPWIRKLNPLDRYLFLYLLTNERTNIAGIYELSLSIMSFETGIDERDLRDAMLPRLEPKVFYTDEWIILPNFIKNQSLNPKIKKGIAYILRDDIPAEIKQAATDVGVDVGLFEEIELIETGRDKDIRKIIKDKDKCNECESEFVKEKLIVHHIKPMFMGGGNKKDNLVILCVNCHKEVHKGIGYDSLSKATIYTNTNSNSNSIKKKGKKKTRSARFSPPSLKEVQDYCKERKNSVDPETFIDFYSSKGWKVGNTKMKDWKASIRTWEKRNKKDGDTKSNFYKLKT